MRKRSMQLLLIVMMMLIRISSLFHMGTERKSQC